MRSKNKRLTRYSPQQKMHDFLHCRKCLEELPEDKSPRDYMHFEIGYTSRGFQVWCLRHECNVIHIDHMNADLPADEGDFGDFGIAAHRVAGKKAFNVLIEGGAHLKDGQALSSGKEGGAVLNT